jgi:hypothetical protein
MVGCNLVNAQVSSKVTNDKFDEYMDSLRDVDYPYPLPIFGNKVRDMGYDLPKPAGIMLGYIYQKQNTEIEDLAVSFGPMEELTDISDVVNFSKTESEVDVATTRLDLWLFPFMNVYGIYNRINSTTNVELSEPFELVIPDINNKGNGFGFGTTLAYGWGPVWASVNGNSVWTKTPVLTTPTHSISSSARIGTHLWNKTRTQHISVWVGANYLNYIGSNGGTYDLSQLLPEEKEKLDDLLGDIQDMLDGLNEKYNEMCSQPRPNPACQVLDPLLEEFKGRVEDKLSGIEQPEALNINYSFNSRPTANWNMVAGAQYTLHKRWDFRIEVGFGQRQSVMTNINYRFGFFPKKNVSLTTSLK